MRFPRATRPGHRRRREPRVSPSARLSTWLTCSSSGPTSPKTCNFAGAGAGKPQIGLAARPASRSYEGRRRRLTAAEASPVFAKGVHPVLAGPRRLRASTALERPLASRPDSLLRSRAAGERRPLSPTPSHRLRTRRRERASAPCPRMAEAEALDQRPERRSSRSAQRPCRRVPACSSVQAPRRRGGALDRYGHRRRAGHPDDRSREVRSPRRPRPR